MRKYILLYTGLLLSVSGCSLLELDESTGLDREEAYSYFSNVKGLATYVYSQLPGDLGVLDGALRESATDNSVYVWSDNSVHDFYNNAWSPNNAVDNMWSSSSMYRHCKAPFYRISGLCLHTDSAPV